MAENILDRFKDGAEDEKVVDTTKKIKVGIIGTGWIAEAHVANYLRCPDVEIVAAAEETKNPDTGANDVVGVAAALAVVSLVAAGAVSLKK